jgi:16S rRNA (guanine527-N7)-methyltransferase
VGTLGRSSSCAIPDVTPTEDWSRRQAIESLARDAPHILGRPLSDRERDRFRRYLDLLHDWNRVHDLTAPSSADEIVQRLLRDSLLFAQMLPSGSLQLADVGSGAGVPGLPLAIIEERLGVTLFEARRKRASFLATVKRELGLDRVTVHHGRVEDVPSQAPALLESFRVVTMRSAAAPYRALELAAPLLSRRGVAIVSLSPSGPVPVLRPRRTLCADLLKQLETRVIEVPALGVNRRFLLWSRPG